MAKDNNYHYRNKDFATEYPEMDMHRISFINYQPSGVVKLSLHKTSTLLSVARVNGSIEFWESKLGTFSFTNSTPICQGKMIQDLVWVGDRIFSGELDGTISEWKFGQTNEINIQQFDIPIWCMEKSASESLLAVGFQDGKIKIFDVIQSQNLEIRCELQKQLGRILSIAWHPEGELVACGLDNSTIAIFSVTKGLCTQRITLDEYRKHSTLVWQIKFLRDNTLITGDSMGKIQFWNGKFGTLKQGYTLHEELSDILAIHVNEKGNRMFASGVDSKVVSLNHVEIEGNSKWIPSNALRIHTHDVKSIVGCEGKFILSGGVDTKIVLYDWQMLERKDTKTILPFTSNARDMIKIAIERKILMFQMPNKLQLWKLFKVTRGVPIDIDCILEIQTKSTDGIITSAISPNAEYVCWSNRKITKFYKLTWESETSLSKIKCIKNGPSQSCQLLTFSEIENVLISLTNNRTISIFNLTNDEVILQFQIDFESAITKIMPSKCGQYFACVGFDSSISIHEFTTFDCICKLPRHQSKVTSLDFSPETTVIVVTYNNGEIIIYDFLIQKHTVWTKLFQDFQCQNLMKSHQIELTDLSVNFVTDDQIIIFSYNGVCLVKLEDFSISKKIETTPRKKKPKVSFHEPNQFEDDNFKIDPKYKSILALKRMNEDEIVLVERPWEDIQKNFPPSLYRDRYGT